MLTEKMLPLKAVVIGLFMSFGLAHAADKAEKTEKAGKAAPPEVRKTVYGAVVGVNDKDVGTYKWLGIPFAKPPVGALRWKPPVEPVAWKKPHSAKKFGNACIQNGRIYGPGLNNRYDDTIAETLNKPVGSEDCLTLNIWRPATTETNLPVIMFVYGGSNISGYSADPAYDGANLAKRANAVVVTMNYRVGIMGFINVAQFKTGDDPLNDSGNFAILDILQSLKFVNKNIENFGGDKGNVTLMGQSAGAINVWAVVASKLSEGLIHKAVPMSGGISMASNLPKGKIPLLMPPAFYGFQGNALLQTLLIDDGKAKDTDSAKAYIETMSKVQIAEYLRSKDAKVILTTVLTKLAPKGMGISGPMPDGTVLPPDPISAFAEGKYKKIPILVSNTSEEGKLFAPFLALSPAFGGKPGFIIDDAARFRLMAKFDGDAPFRPRPNYALGMAGPPFDGVPYDELVKIMRLPDSKSSLIIDDIVNPVYLPANVPTTGWSARTKVLGDAFLAGSAANAMDSLIKQQPNVWYYEFKWAQEPAPWNEIYGAAHLFDIPFVFGNFGPSVFSKAMFNKANKQGREELSDAMMESVRAFARNGDPNNAALGVKWEPWPKKLIFDATLSAKRISVE
jgi:para-nitrobenzyl esterase